MTDDALPLKVMAVLQQHTDENHKLTQAQLGRLLEREFGSAVPARLLRRVLRTAAAFDDSIEYDEIDRGRIPDSDGSRMRTNFFFRHPFSDSELRLLADSIAFLPYLPSGQRAQLLQKICALGSRHFQVRPLLATAPPQEENKQLFLNIELLDEAIRLGHKISATYLTYDAGKRLRSRRDQNGRVRTYRLSPYRLLMNAGRYYLICNNERYDDLSHYRIDRLLDIRLLDEPIRPLRDLDPGKQTETDAYIREHVYMYSGDCVRARLRLRTACIPDAVDLFGPAITFDRADGEWIGAAIRAHPLAVCRFVRSLGAAAVLEAPQYLRDRVRDELAAALTLYGV